MKKQRLYTGYRKPDGTTAVTVDHGVLLPPRLDLRRHAESFEWGYGEAGPAQLALAVLADCLGDDERALALYRQFKRRVVWKLPSRGWTLGAAEVEDAVAQIERQSARERLADLLGVVIKAECHACGKHKTFWAHDRDSVLRQIDESGWREDLATEGGIHFRCPECRR